MLSTMAKKGRRARGTQAAQENKEPLFSRPLIWMGSSKDDISEMPKPVKVSFGYRLRRIQEGRATTDTKAMPQFGPGVFELRESFDTNAYRVAYVVKLKSAVYVLHAFMKKSKSGIGLPKSDAALIASRLKRAIELEKENNDEEN